MWLKASLAKDGSVDFKAASDSQITRGLCSVLIKALSGLTPEQILEVGNISFLEGLASCVYFLFKHANACSANFIDWAISCNDIESLSCTV